MHTHTKTKQYISNLLDAMAKRKQFWFTKIFHVCKHILKGTVLKNLFCKGLGVRKYGKRMEKIKRAQYVFLKYFGSQIAYSIKRIWHPPHWNLLLVSKSTVKERTVNIITSDIQQVPPDVQLRKSDATILFQEQSLVKITNYVSMCKLRSTDWRHAGLESILFFFFFLFY